MESLTGPDFKTEALKEICDYRDKILKFVHDTFNVAEGAVEKVLHRDAAVVDFIKNLEESTLLLKMCRERFAVVDSHLPTEPFPNQKGLLPAPNQPTNDVIPNNLVLRPSSSAVICQIPVAKVVFNEAYKVEIVDGDVGNPTWFWLKLMGSSSRRMEEELKETYQFHPKMEKLPMLGTFVVCKSGNKFCRAKVVTIVECKSRESNTVEVILVDYGQMKPASLSDLYPIESRFCAEPAIGLLCGLKDIKPLQGDFWEMGSVIFFNEQCRDDLTAIFHSPAEELTETFSKFQPDFWVSLHKKGALKGMVQDIRYILIKEGMAKDGSSDPKPDFPVWSLGDAPAPARPMSASSKQLISPAPPSLPRPSSKQLISPAPPSLPGPSSKQLTSSSNSSLTRPNSSSKQLNINAPEFVLPKEKQANLLGHSSNSSSLLSSKSRVHDFIPDTSSGFVPRKPRSSLRAHSVKKSGSSSDATPSSLRSSVVDGEVDAIMKKSASPPQPILENRDTSAQLDEEAESVPVLHRPVDRLLMDQFLQSLECRPTSNSDKSLGSDGLSRMSFVSAATHISKRSEPSFDGSDKQPARIHLDYQYDKMLERRPLPTSTKLTVQLSYVFHPNHFYVHIKDEVPTLVEPLVKRLNELYRHSEPVPVQLPEIGSFWVAKENKMNNWARVLVVEVNVVKGVTKVTVLSVDWGFVEVVELSQLRPLVPQVSDTPCLALCFRLAGVYPLNKSMDSEDWPKEATDTFIKWATSEDDFIALIEDRDQRGGQWSVLMFKGLEEDEITLNEFLVNLKLASSTIFPLGTRAVQPINEDEQCLLDQEFPNWDPMAADFYSSRNTTAIDMENYDSATAGHIPRDDEEICRFFRANGSCPRGIRCGLKHIKPNSNTFTQDKMMVFIDLPVLASPIPGSTILLHVTCVSRSYRFYCVLPHGPFDLSKSFANVNEDAETLETLQVAIQQEYNENHQLHRVTLNPSAGDIVIARSPDDKMWYRGRVMEELENEAFAIFFVDFGNKRPVPMKDVCLPLNRFTHLPMQAVEMFLNGIDRDSDTIEARNELVNLVKGKDLVARVIHDNPVLLVDLFDTNGPKQVDLAEELIRRRVVNRGLCHKLNLSSRGQFIAG